MAGEYVMQFGSVRAVCLYIGEESGEVLAASGLQGDGREVLGTHDACGCAFKSNLASLFDSLAQQGGLSGQELHGPVVDEDSVASAVWPRALRKS